MKCELGDCVYVLFHKLWGKTLVKGKLKSEAWWKKRLEDLINRPPITLTLGPLPESEPAPIPFEIEMGFPDLNYEIFNEAWRRTKEKRERKVYQEE